MSEILLEMKNITKRFPGTVALRSVNIHLREGEILAIVGENGAGKSTLMKILSGAYPHTSYEGEIFIHEVRQRFDSPKVSERAGIEMIYQEINPHLDLTIGENIFLGQLPTRGRWLVDWDEVFDRTEEALKKVGLDESPREIVRNLSASKQQLVAIAKALARNPRIMVLDEPTAALTEKETENLLQLLLELKKKGISCIYISHKLQEVYKIADRVTVLREGETVSNYAGKEIVNDVIVEDMIGRKLEQMFPKSKVAIGGELFRVKHFTVPHPYTYNKNIVNDVSFCVNQGEILGLGGLVGAGRSELVNAIFGTIEHNKEAKIFIEGGEVTISNPVEAIKVGIGLLTEDRKKNGYIGTMDISQNISLASLHKISNYSLINFDKEQGFARFYSEKLDIRASRLSDELSSLSGGNQQKVVLAKWLMTNLKVLILDEPTRGIDIGAKVKIYNLMGELVQQGAGIIMISSELPELLAMCDRVIVLADGHITGEFLREKVSYADIIKAATCA